MKNLYSILRISKDATNEQIISAFRTQAKLNHPDISKDSNAGEKIKDIYEARNILTDPIKRKEYDELLSTFRMGVIDDDYDTVFDDSIKSASFDASEFINRSFNIIKLLIFFPFYISRLLGTIFLVGFIGFYWIAGIFALISNLHSLSPKEIILALIGISIGFYVVKFFVELIKGIFLQIKQRFIDEFNI